MNRRQRLVAWLHSRPLRTRLLVLLALVLLLKRVHTSLPLRHRSSSQLGE